MCIVHTPKAQLNYAHSKFLDNEGILRIGRNIFVETELILEVGEFYF